MARKDRRDGLAQSDLRRPGATTENRAQPLAERLHPVEGDMAGTKLRLFEIILEAADAKEALPFYLDGEVASVILFPRLRRRKPASAEFARQPIREGGSAEVVVDAPRASRSVVSKVVGLEPK